MSAAAGVPTAVVSNQSGIARGLVTAAQVRAVNARVEELLVHHCQGRTAYVSRAATHLMMAGGKRFRPLLVLLAAETGTHPEAEEVHTAACVVELTHVASLYHDDVMDAPRQNFLPRASHVPRNVIQNDSRMSRTSSQNDCLRI